MKKNILLILLGLVFVIGLLISNCQAQNEGNEASTTTEEVAEPPRRDHGVSPVVILQVPISFGETQTEIRLHENEQPEDAAREFCVTHKIDVSNAAQLVGELEKRLPPLVVSIPLSLGEGNIVNLKIYQGWDIRKTIDAFKAKYGLSDNDGQTIYEEVQKNMPLVTLQVQGPDGKTIDPPLQLLNGQSPDVVSLEYCYTHKLDIPSYAHELNKELRSRVPEELRNSYPPLRKVMLVIPFETANGIQRTPFYETDIPAKFSENLCTQFNGGDGCYDRVLDYVNTQIGVVTNKEEQATAQATEAAAEAASETNNDAEAKEKAAAKEAAAAAAKAKADAEAAAIKEQAEKEQAAAAKAAAEKKEATLAAKAAKEASKTTIHATTDDSNVKGEPPLDQLRTMLQPTWDKVYKAMGSPKAIPSDPLFLVVPAFAIIGLILGATTSGGGKSSTKASKTSATKNTTEEKDNDKKTSKSSSTRSKRSSTPSARGKSKRN